MLHPQSLKNFALNPDVLMFDSTYKTNIYGSPLLNLVGSSCMNTTIQVRLALLNGQREADFAKCLAHLIKAFQDHEVALPRVVVTDRDKATINAIDKILPSIPHVICRWHFKTDVLSYARELKGEWGSIHSPTPGEPGRRADSDKTCRFWDLF